MKSYLNIHPITYLFLLITFLLGLFKQAILILFIIIIHEYGHVFIAKIFKRKIKSIYIFPFGGLTILDGEISTNIYEDLLISVGGFLFQIIIFLINNFLFSNNFISINFYQNILFYNTIIMAFNLLPIYPLDGAKIIEHFLELFIPFKYVIYPFILINFSTLIFIITYDYNILKDNILILSFIILLTYKKIKNQKFILNRFYLERMLKKYNYPLKKIKSIKRMYKNKYHIIKDLNEEKYIRECYYRRV